MNTTEQKKRRKKHRKRTKKKERPVNNGIPFKWEYAFESLTERGSVFRRNYPDYD